MTWLAPLHRPFDTTFGLLRVRAAAQAVMLAREASPTEFLHILGVGNRQAPGSLL